MALFFGDLRIWGVMLLAIVALIVASAIYPAWIGHDDEADPRGPR